VRPQSGTFSILPDLIPHPARISRAGFSFFQPELTSPAEKPAGFFHMQHKETNVMWNNPLELRDELKSKPCSAGAARWI